MNSIGHLSGRLSPGLTSIEQLFADELSHGRVFNAKQTLDVWQGELETMGSYPSRLRPVEVSILRTENGANVGIQDQARN